MHQRQQFILFYLSQVELSAEQIAVGVQRFEQSIDSAASLPFV